MMQHVMDHTAVCDDLHDAENGTCLATAAHHWEICSGLSVATLTGVGGGVNHRGGALHSRRTFRSEMYSSILFYTDFTV